ncbi:MAG: IS5 family transposase [Lentisphaeria bacterium]|nr:MAG: IS5 family transposase [Lentisphaeria bacterium]
METDCIFSAIVYVLRTGIIWNALPRKEFENITSQAVHKNLCNGHELDFFKSFGTLVLWSMTRWKGLHGNGSRRMVLMEKRHWRKNLPEQIQQTGVSKEAKKNLLVDAVGIPLSIVVTGANRHDAAVLDELLKERMKPLDFEHYKHITQNVCLDAGYVGKADVASRHGMVPHIRPRGEEKKAIELHGFRPKRWIVEVAHSWFNRFRKIHVRYEKTACAYNALLYLAAMMITMNKIMAIYPPL